MGRVAMMNMDGLLGLNSIGFVVHNIDNFLQPLTRQ